MTRKEYEETLMKRMYAFLKAYDDLVELFDGEEIDCNDYITDDYPFDKSFDEINVSDWVFTTEEKIKKSGK